MSEIQRYMDTYGDLIDDDEGEVVYFEDHKNIVDRLEDENAELRRAIEKLREDER